MPCPVKVLEVCHEAAVSTLNSWTTDEWWKCFGGLARACVLMKRDVNDNLVELAKMVPEGVPLIEFLLSMGKVEATVGEKLSIWLNALEAFKMWCRHQKEGSPCEIVLEGRNAPVIFSAMKAYFNEVYFSVSCRMKALKLTQLAGQELLETPELEVMELQPLKFEWREGKSGQRHLFPILSLDEETLPIKKVSLYPLLTTRRQRLPSL